MLSIEAILGTVVVIPVDNGERTTESGIVISQDSAEVKRAIKGKVVATGGQKLIGDRLVDMQAKAGDTVIFDTYKASEMDFEGQRYYKIEEEKLFGILR